MLGLRKGACIIAFAGWFRLFQDLAPMLIIFAVHSILANTGLVILSRFDTECLHVFN